MNLLSIIYLLIGIIVCYFLYLLFPEKYYLCTENKNKYGYIINIYETIRVWQTIHG